MQEQERKKREALVSELERKGHPLGTVGGAWDFRVSEKFKDFAVLVHVATGGALAFHASLSSIGVREAPGAPAEKVSTWGPREKTDSYFKHQLANEKKLLSSPGSSPISAFLSKEGKASFGAWTFELRGDSIFVQHGEKEPLVLSVAGAMLFKGIAFPKVRETHS